LSSKTKVDVEFRQPVFCQTSWCALNDEYSFFKDARECKSLKRGGSSEVLASRKGDNSDVISEVSGTANTCTDA